MRILLVNGEEAIIDSISLTLKKHGHKLIAKSNITDALNILESENFDVIVIDLIFPYVSGFDFIKRVRRNNTTTPIIVISSLPEFPNKDKVFKLGADKYFPKPASVDNLLATLNNIEKFSYGSNIIQAQFG